MNIDIKNVLFWIFLFIGIILLLWNIFGKSPQEFIATVTLIFAVLLKTWSVSDRVIKLEMGFKHLASDFKEHVNNKKIHR